MADPVALKNLLGLFFPCALNDGSQNFIRLGRKYVRALMGEAQFRRYRYHISLQSIQVEHFLTTHQPLTYETYRL